MSKIPSPSQHPRQCLVCSGTGWEPGPPIPGHHQGKSFEYTTLRPCSHVWYDDDPDIDEHGLDRTTTVTFAEYYARLLDRHARRVPGADAELAGWDRLRDTGIVRDV